MNGKKLTVIVLLLILVAAILMLFGDKTNEENEVVETNVNNTATESVGPENENADQAETIDETEESAQSTDETEKSNVSEHDQDSGAEEEEIVTEIENSVVDNDGSIGGLTPEEIYSGENELQYEDELF